MKKILLISLITLFVMILAFGSAPNTAYAMDLTTTATTAEVTEEVTTAEPVVAIEITPEQLKIALGELIDEWIGDYIAPLGITGAMLVAALLTLLGYILKSSTENRRLQLAGEKLIKDNTTDVSRLVKAVTDNVAPELGKIALEQTRSNAFASVIANGLDILIMNSNNDGVARASKEFHKQFSEALSIKDADSNVVQNIRNSLVNVIKSEAGKVVENTANTLAKVTNDRLAKLRAAQEPAKAESGV